MLQRTLRLYRDSFVGLRREVWFLSATLFVNRAGNMVIPFLTLYLTQQRGFSLSRAGIVMACFGVGAITGSYLGGWLTERWGFFRVQLLSLIGSGLLFFWLMQLESFGMLCLGVMVLSIVGDAFRPASQTAVSHYSTPENRARAFGLQRLAINLGFSAGPAAAGLLIAGIGYRALFIVDGLTCLAAALFFFITVPFTGAETERPAPNADGLATPQASALRPIEDKPFLFFCFCYFLGAVAFIQFFSTLPVFLKEDLRFEEWQIGALVTINGIIIVLTEMPLVHYLNLNYRPIKLMILGAILYGLAFLTLVLATEWAVIPLVFILLLTVGEMLKMPFASTWVANRAEGRRRGLYMGMYGLSFSTGLILAPALGTWCAEQYGFSVLWLIAGCLGLASAMGLHWLQRWTD